MLFTTSINLAVSRSVRGQNSGVDRVCNRKTNHDRRAIKLPIREENGFDKKKGTYDLLHFFGRNTAYSNHLSPPE